MRGVLFAGSISLFLTLFGTRVAIKALVARELGQPIRDDGPTTHHTKRGTPTMGGLVVIIAVVIGYAAAKILTQSPPTASALLLLFLFVGLGLIGFIDDWIKISRQVSLGLRSTSKFIGQAIVGLLFAVLAMGFPDEYGRTPISSGISFIRDISGWELPAVAVVIWVLFMVASASNAVNISDGLDGLATGMATMVFAAFILINVWQSRQSCAYTPGPTCYEVRDPLDLAVVAAALTGATFGFLWWNASPAKIFMGDTGSLSLGGVMAGFAIMTRTELLLVILAGMFVAITASVILQVGYFKITKGKRLFRMAPLQHHFELLGWEEITIVIRFWIVAGVSVAVALGIFYAEWVVGI